MMDFKNEIVTLATELKKADGVWTAKVVEPPITHQTFMSVVMRVNGGIATLLLYASTADRLEALLRWRDPVFISTLQKALGEALDEFIANDFQVK